MSKNYDVVVIGAGPGGYVAAIRASQLGKKVAIIEKEKLGGVCLNKGCIPTKALLTSAHAAHHIQDLASLGVELDLKSIRLKPEIAVKRAMDISSRISKGVSFLMKKNSIEVLMGEAKFLSNKTLSVGNEVISFSNAIIATGARYKTFPGLEHDGKLLIGAWEAVSLATLPKRMAIIGAGAIGVEFAYFWNAFGVEVSIFERQSHLLPLEDEDSSLEIEKAFKKYGIKYFLALKDVKVKTHEGKVIVETESLEGKKEQQTFDQALIAVGMTGNYEGLNLESLGIKTEKGFISTNESYQTSLPHIYAIGDISGPPLLAHAASHEGILAAEHLSGLKIHPLDKKMIPACTYCIPQVASVGYTEKELKEKNIPYRLGKIPFVANGKALASNEKEGHVKILLGKYGELLGAHIVGNNATELIHELALLKSMEGVSENVAQTIHPHPTLGEWISEAVLAAEGRSLNY